MPPCFEHTSCSIDLPCTRGILGFSDMSADGRPWPYFSSLQNQCPFQGEVEFAPASSALYNPFTFPFLIPLQTIKCQMTCDFSGCLWLWQSSPFLLPLCATIRPPRRNLAQQPESRRTRATSQLKSYVIVWRLLKSEGKTHLAKIFCFLEAEKSGSEVYCIRHCSI